MEPVKKQTSFVYFCLAHFTCPFWVGLFVCSIILKENGRERDMKSICVALND